MTDIALHAMFMVLGAAGCLWWVLGEKRAVQRELDHARQMQAFATDELVKAEDERDRLAAQVEDQW